MDDQHPSEHDTFSIYYRVFVLFMGINRPLLFTIT